MSTPLFRFAPLWLAFGLAALTADGAQPTFGLLHSLFDPGTNAQAGPEQGSTVAMHGNFIVSGAPLDAAGGAWSGTVKVYDATTGALLHTLTNPAPARYEWFGAAVAISGARVVVGAALDASSTGGGGIAYVYDLGGTMPTQPVLTLTNPSPAKFDYFGYAAAIDGTRVAIGADQDDTGATNSGSASVFDLSGATPTTPVATLNSPSPAIEDYYGFSVAASGSLVVVGAPRDDTRATDAGIVLVFGSSLLSVAESGGYVEFTGDEIEHGNHIFPASLAAGFALHGAAHAVEPFQKAGA